MKGNVVKKICAWLPVFLWAALIFHLSSGTIPIASKIYWQDFAVKKTGHVLLFGALSILIYRALRIEKVEKKHAAIWAVLLATFYGGTDEFHQMFTQGRESRLRDVFIDGIGAALVVWVAYYLPLKLSKNLYKIIEKFDIT